MYQKAIKNKLYMGLDNKICTSPRYWCRLHEIYLSQKDMERRNCKGKPTFDMIGVEKCRNLEEI